MATDVKGKRLPCPVCGKLCSVTLTDRYKLAGEWSEDWVIRRHNRPTKSIGAADWACYGSRQTVTTKGVTT